MVSAERLLHRVAGSPEHSPREIAAKGVLKVVREKIISQGESASIRMRRCVVRGEHRRDPNRGGNLRVSDVKVENDRRLL